MEGYSNCHVSSPFSSLLISDFLCLHSRDCEEEKIEEKGNYADR